jgi:hypothetical protein
LSRCRRSIRAIAGHSEKVLLDLRPQQRRDEVLLVDLRRQQHRRALRRRNRHPLRRARPSRLSTARRWQE